MMYHLEGKVSLFVVIFFIMLFIPGLLFRSESSTSTMPIPKLTSEKINIAHLFTTNALVDAHNKTLYTLSKADKAQIKG